MAAGLMYNGGMEKHHANLRTGRGFTLVELLVVVGIIALLISILLPALNKAQAHAVAVQCRSNMRQIAHWGFQYAQDWRGWLPHNGWSIDPATGVGPDWAWWEISSGRWFNSQVPQEWRANKSSVLYCPLTQKMFGDHFYANMNTNDYGMNHYMGARCSRDSVTKQPSIPWPKQKLLKAKAYWLGEAHFGIYQGRYYPWEYLSTPGYDPWMWQVDIPLTTSNPGHPNRTCNFVYGDGHVEPLRREDVYNMNTSQKNEFQGKTW
jgi:prepilin-type N-terminal cleavage/methylation domain-containing protein/prepilin-type processing-associated H-X9-DG protein